MARSQTGTAARYIERAGAVNGAMPHYVVSLVNDAQGRSQACRPGDTGARRPDCLVIVTDHSAFDCDVLQRAGREVVDTRNVIAAPAARVPAGRSGDVPVAVEN